MMTVSRLQKIKRQNLLLKRFASVESKAHEAITAGQADLAAKLVSVCRSIAKEYRRAVNAELREVEVLRRGEQRALESLAG